MKPTQAQLDKAKADFEAKGGKVQQLPPERDIHRLRTHFHFVEQTGFTPSKSGIVEAGEARRNMPSFRQKSLDDRLRRLDRKGRRTMLTRIAQRKERLTTI